MRAGSEAGRAVAVLALFALATGWVLWPLVRHGMDHVLDVHRFYGPAGWLLAADPWLCMWILGWDTHALLTAPAHLFDANIFHPAPLTLALSEHLLGYWPLFAPVYLATGSTVAAYAATILLSFALTGAAMCALVWHWTGSRATGVVGGLVFAFAPWRLSQLAHLQLLGLYALPLVLLFWDRALARGRAVDLAALGASFLLQCLCSYYLAYCAALVVAVYAVITSFGAPPGRVLRAGAALGLGAAAFALLSVPYLRVRASGLLPEQGLGEQLALGVPSWRAYLDPAAVAAAIRSYQGRVALGLAALGLLAAPGGRARAVAIGAILVAGYLLALGPAGSPSLYAWLWRWLPGFSTTRVPARFVIVVAFAVAALAGLGWGTVVGRLPGAARTALTVAVCALVAWDFGLPRFALPVERVDALSPVYPWLAAHGGREPLLELPVRGWTGDLAGALREQRYAWASTAHWLPQLTGRSGYLPSSYELLMPIVRTLPDRGVLESLVRLTGLHWIVVHGDVPGWGAGTPEGLELAAEFGPDRVYRVARPVDADQQAALVARLRGAPETTTLGGTPLRALPTRDLRADFLRADLPARTPPTGAVGATIVVRNAGRRTWPALALATDRLVVVRARWEGRGARRVPLLRLAADTPPGEDATLSVVLPAPVTPGRHRLVLRVIQGGRAGGRAVRMLEVAGS